MQNFAKFSGIPLKLPAASTLSAVTGQHMSMLCNRPLYFFVMRCNDIVAMCDFNINRAYLIICLFVLFSKIKVKLGGFENCRDWIELMNAQVVSVSV